MGQWQTRLQHHSHLLIIVKYATLTELQRELHHLILIRVLGVAAAHRRLLPVDISMCSVSAVLDYPHHELVQLPADGRRRVLPATHAARDLPVVMRGDASVRLRHL